MSWTLAGVVALWVALAVDRFWGEPPASLHPVVAMGRYLSAWEGLLLRVAPASAFVGGALAWMAGACMLAVLGLFIEMGLMLVAHSLALPEAVSALGMGVLLGLALKPLLAWRMLRDEVAGVEQGLAVSLDEGRQRLRRLVSRDVRALDEATVRESAIETLAENLNDSLVAPLFWFALTGLAGVAVYRFANTADAMWGYRGRHEWMGKWAARSDDVLSWVPARLTALLLCLAAGRWPGWHAMRHEAGHTPSPNGGWPMGTMALLLGVRLCKPGAYALNAAQPSPGAAHTRQALLWAERAVWLLAALLSLLMLWWPDLAHEAHEALKALQGLKAGA